MKTDAFRRGIMLPLLVLSSFASAFLASPAPAATFPDGSIPGSVGIQLKNSNMNATHLDIVDGVAPGFVRKAVYWSNIEPTAGTYNWSQPDNWISLMESRGFSMLITVVWNNRAYEDLHDRSIVTAAGRTAYANFCQALATRYAGKNIIWEIWNEPNTSSFWDSGSTVLNKAVEYTALVKAAVPKFKLGIPRAKS